MVRFAPIEADTLAAPTEILDRPGAGKEIWGDTYHCQIGGSRKLIRIQTRVKHDPIPKKGTSELFVLGVQRNHVWQKAVTA